MTISTPSPRVGHSMTPFSQGKKILVFGGASFEEGYSNDVWIYEVADKTWNLMNKAISSNETDEKGVLQFPSPRYEHSAEIVEDKFLIIYGGCGDLGVLNDMWILDLNAWKYTKMTEKGSPSARTIQSAKLFTRKSMATAEKTLEDYSLFVFGGGISDNRPVEDPDIHIFDFKSRTWKCLSLTDTAMKPSPRFGHSLEIVGAKAFLFGGMNERVSFNDLWQFDFESSRWQKIETPQSPDERGGHVSAMTEDGHMFIHGGMNKFDQKEVKILKDAHIYSIENNEWIKIVEDSGVESLVDHAAVFIRPNVYIFGGMNEAGVYNKMTVFSI